MFGLFKKKDPVEKLRKEYKQLMERAFELSKTDRAASDRLHAEADLIMSQIEQLKTGVE